MKSVLRMGSELSKPTPPCEEKGTPLAEYRYDFLNRRVYGKVGGKEVFSLYGPSGELLAEASASGVVERLFAYLEGEPLAMVVTKEGTALRPSAGPQPGCSAAGAGYTALAICLALVFVGLGRKRGRGAVLSALLLLAVLASTCGPVDGVKPHGNGSAKTKPGRGASLKDPLYFFHNDRLGTPVRLTDEKGAVVWRAEYRPFGDLHQLKTDPDGDGVHIEQPLRFPGQYDEALWGLVALGGPYYNWHRWYSPDIGRYVQPEPILLNPGYVQAISRKGPSAPVYAYALNNPAAVADPNGLYPIGPEWSACFSLCMATFGYEAHWSSIFGADLLRLPVTTPFLPWPKEALPPFQVRPLAGRGFGTDITTPLSSLGNLCGTGRKPLGAFLRGAGRALSWVAVGVELASQGVKAGYQAACTYECFEDDSVALP